MSRRRNKKLPSEPVSTEIISLSHEGRGVAQLNNKTTFVEGALPGEIVLFRYKRQRSRYDEGNVVEILTPSPDRIIAKCQHFGICGGCSLQHIDPLHQINHKQSVLIEQLAHIGNVQPAEILPPLLGPVWGYRNKARLGIKYVENKQRVLIGFREKFGPFIADLQHCDVLHPTVGNLLAELQELIGKLSIFKQIPQIEVAVAENATALVVRHLAAFNEEDLNRLKEFSKHHNIDFYLQPAGLESVAPLLAEQSTPLSYSLPDHSVEIIFWPTDFTQVNFSINRQMINLALELLRLNPDDRVLDLFCGLGNFTLPIARKVAKVIGVEGDNNLIERARFNALHNGINNADFHCVNLAEEELQATFLQHKVQKLLLDPPRCGAQEIIQNLDFESIDRIVYVSCNPATLARDSGILVNEKGFRLQQTAVMDMFPHTTHVESIALFTR